MTSEQPTIAGDRFVVRRKLGEGGMGVVYEAFDRERGAIVALKTLAAADAAGIYRLKKEFRALADLSHPNLVALHELHRAGDRWFLVMELVNGVDFIRWVRGEASQSVCTVTSELAWDVATEPPEMPAGSFDETRLRDALAQLAGALRALHDAGRLHCDLKPSNVLVGEDGRLTILDFGIARIRSFGTAQLSLESTIVGTPAYMAPEQASGDALSPATDWYSVGVMLYESLTGVTPFGGSIAELVTSKQFAEPPDPRELVRDVPDDLASLTVELLRARPEARPSGDDAVRCLLGARAQIPARAPQQLWGREAELAALREAFEHAQHQAELVLIEGSPGVGKSALLAAFAASLPPTAIVLRGRCHERESMPYKAFDEVIDALARHLRGREVGALRELLPQNMHALARVFPVLGRLSGVSEMPASERRALDPSAFRRLAFGALGELLKKLASDVVIVIDDLAWGDLDSAALLAELLAHPRLLVVGSFRSGDVVSSPLLRCLLAPSWCEQLAAEPLHIALGPLAPGATEALARELLGDAALAAALAHESRGNPELVVELAGHVHAHGYHAGLQLDRMLAARVATLSADARRLLEILAAAAGSLPVAVALRAAGIPGERSMRAVAELMSARLATSRRSDDEEEIDVYQARVREAVEIDAQHHRALAVAFEAHKSAPERIADHFDRAGDRARAAEFLERAAREAEDALAFDRAAQLLRRAHDLTNDVALSERLGHALANAGRSAQAADAYLTAARAGGSNRLEL
ncbi:MAG TPA: protein kinase, partial [Polyangiaceae bacterium]|nr:protein kinase [Polyangiaceae bacterium]